MKMYEYYMLFATFMMEKLFPLFSYLDSFSP